MKRKMKWMTTLFMVSILFVSMLAPLNASAQSDLGLKVDAAILIDADTGKILYEQNAHTSLGIASMAKMMTEYILLEAIEEGKVKWDQQYRVNEYTYKVSQDMALSNVPLRADGTYTIKELYEAMVIYSANAATIAIAETIAGSEKEFIKLMNKKAEELGLEGYKFVNSTGLNNSYLFGMHPEGTGENDENVMTAASVAKLAYRLLKDFPEVLETASIPHKVFREGTDDQIDMKNWNFMLPGLDYEYADVDGLKTGTTDFAGHCFTGTAERNGKRLISVVMKAVDSEGVGSYKARFDETAKLFDYGFSQFEEVEIIPENYQIEGKKSLPVTKGKEDKVGIATKESISLMLKNGDEELYKPKLVLDEKELEAGVEKGTVVGKLVLERTEGTDYGYLDGKEIAVDVVTTEAVERSGKIALFFQAIGGFFGNLWGSVTGFVGGLF